MSCVLLRLTVLEQVMRWTNPLGDLLDDHAGLLALQQSRLTSQQPHLVRLEQQPIDLQVVLVVLRARVGRVRVTDDRVAVVHNLLAQQTLTQLLVACVARRLIHQAERAQLGLILHAGRYEFSVQFRGAFGI